MTDGLPHGTLNGVTTQPGFSRVSHAVLGLDLGGSSIKWAVLEPNDSTPGHRHDHDAGRERIIASGRVPTPLTGTDDVLAALAGVVTDVCSTVLAAPLATPLAAPRVRVGLAAAAIIDSATQSVLVVPNIPGDWAGRPLGAELAAACGQPVSLVNDARAFALGQLRYGAAATASDAVFVTLGTGVGGAVASDGALRLGAGARGGELGHIPVVPDGGRRCGCGATGCLETVAGGRALAEMGADLVRAGAAPALAALVEDKAEAVTAGDVVAAATDDASCAALVTDAGRALGLALAAITTTLAPEVVVVGGGLAAALPVLAPHIDEAFAQRARLVPAPRVVPASFGNLAGAVGAAAWARCPPAATVTVDGERA